MYCESYARSLAKSISWRFWGAGATILLVFIFTGRLELAVSVGIAEVFAKIFLQFLHERAWDKFSFGKKQMTPAVIWFTGLPCSGKTTLSKSIYEKLVKKGIKAEHLDGDDIRKLLPGTGFTKEDRSDHIRRIGHLVSLLEKNGVTVVCSFVSPYADDRNFVKNICKNFVEIYISTPLEVCETRDTKGMYAKARAGQLFNFTGVQDPYEAPISPDLDINTAVLDIKIAEQRIWATTSQFIN